MAHLRIDIDFLFYGVYLRFLVLFYFLFLLFCNKHLIRKVGFLLQCKTSLNWSKYQFFFNEDLSLAALLIAQVGLMGHLHLVGSFVIICLFLKDVDFPATRATKQEIWLAMQCILEFNRRRSKRVKTSSMHFSPTSQTIVRISIMNTNVRPLRPGLLLDLFAFLRSCF